MPSLNKSKTGTYINIFDMFGGSGNCIIVEDGQRLYDIIFRELIDARLVKLDFSGCGIFTATFFNHSIGQLFKDFSSDELNRLLKISGLTGEGLYTMKRVIENSKLYYKTQLETRCQT